jgi:nickel/cobalt transporter (NicO) family protein
MRWLAFLMCGVLAALAWADSSGQATRKRFDWKPAPAAQARSSPATPSLDPLGELKLGIEMKQKDLRDMLVRKVELVRSGNVSSLAWFLLICLVYGVIHALGPGHGKSVVTGYFLARRGSWWQGVALSSAITWVHVGSAVLLLYTLYWVARATVFPSFESGRTGLEKWSALLLMATGSLLMVSAVLGRFRSQKTATAPHGVLATPREMLWVALATGIVPCPAVALVVLFCLVQGMALLGLAGAVAIGLGMALTNISFGLAAVFLRRAMDRGAGRLGRYAEFLHTVLTVAGGALILALGLLLV